MSLDRLIRAHDDLREVAVLDAIGCPFAAARLISGLIVIAHAERRLAPTRSKIVDAAHRYRDATPGLLDRVLQNVAGLPYYTRSTETLSDMAGEGPKQFVARLKSYADSFSEGVRAVLGRLQLDEVLDAWARSARWRPSETLAAVLDLADADADAAMGAVWDAYAEVTYGGATPPVAALIARLVIHDEIGPTRGVHDSNCENGALLTAMARALPPDTPLTGAGRSEPQIALTAVRLFLADRRADLSLSRELDAASAVADVACVVSASTGATRWHSPGRTHEPVLAGLERMRRASGRVRAAFLLPQTWLTGLGEFPKLRRQIAETRWLDRIVALPLGALYGLNVTPDLWLLDTRRSPDTPIGLVDARRCHPAGGRHGLDADVIERRVHVPDPQHDRFVSIDDVVRGCDFPEGEPGDVLAAALAVMARATDDAQRALDATTLAALESARDGLDRALRAYREVAERETARTGRGAD